MPVVAFLSPPAELITACRAVPDNDLGWLALADWLEARGDPRGAGIRWWLTTAAPAADRAAADADGPAEPLPPQWAAVHPRLATLLAERQVRRAWAGGGLLALAAGGTPERAAGAAAWDWGWYFGEVAATRYAALAGAFRLAAVARRRNLDIETRRRSTAVLAGKASAASRACAWATCWSLLTDSDLRETRHLYWLADAAVPPGTQFPHFQARLAAAQHAAASEHARAVWAVLPLAGRGCPV